MMDAMNKIDKDKVKAALEKRRRLKAGVARKVDVMDDDDLLESELEHGVELEQEPTC
jgi:cyclin T